MKIKNYRFLGKFLFLDCRYAMGGNDDTLLHIFNLWYAGLDLPGTIDSYPEGGYYVYNEEGGFTPIMDWAVIDDNNLCLGYIYAVLDYSEQIEQAVQMEKLKEEIKQIYKTL